MYFGVAKNGEKREKMHVPRGACDMHITKLLRMPLTDETRHIITRSSVRSATKTPPILRPNEPEGEDQPQDLRSEVLVYDRPHPDGSEEPSPMSILNF